MPAQSEAQRRWAFGVKGPAWAKEHHFDNPGKLPYKKFQDGGTVDGHEVRRATRADLIPSEGPLPMWYLEQLHKQGLIGKPPVPIPSENQLTPDAWTRPLEKWKGTRDSKVPVTDYRYAPGD